jgi:hypothetical protein
MCAEKLRACSYSSNEEVLPVHTMKGYGGATVPLHSFLTLALDKGEWLTSLPSRFTSG